MLDLFQENFNEIVATDVVDDMKPLTDLFAVARETQQKVTNAFIAQEELLFLVPRSPILKPGTLLGRVTPLDSTDEHIPSSWGRIPCDSDDTERLHVQFPDSYEFDYLFSKKRFMDKTLMVMGDRIEIFKSIRATSSVSKGDNTDKTKTFFRVTHYVDVLDENKRYLLKTNMFANTEYSSEYNCEALVMDDNLDNELIKHL